MSNAATRRGGLPRLVPLAALLVSLLVAQACTENAPATSPTAVPGSSSPSAVPTAAAIPLDLCANLGTDCTLEAGSYLAQLFEPNLAFELGSGWLNDVYSSRAMQILHGEKSGVSFISGQLDPVEGSLGTTAADFVAYLRGRSGLTAGAPMPVTIDGQAGVALDVTIGPKATVLFDRPIAGGPPDRFLVSPTEQARFIALDVRDERVLIVIEALAPDELTAFLHDQAEPLLDSLRFPAPVPSASSSAPEPSASP
ncbi:MAG: hypothetical protein ACXVAE_05250 [Candidatus Limnocylindrales bacterium]